MQTDRPSFSAAAALVPVRSLQLEAGGKRTSGSSERKLEWGQVLLRYGMSSRVELRLGLNSYSVIDSASGESDGIEDTLLAAKLGLRGAADGALPAVSLLPALSIPSGHSDVSNDATLPSLTLLLDWSLGGPFSLTSNLGWGRVRFAKEDYSRLSASALLGVELTGRLSGFAEAYVFNREVPAGRSTSYVDAGLVYEIGRTFTLDASIGAGVDGTDTDYFFGVGLGKRW